MLTTLQFAPAAPLTLIWFTKTLRPKEKDHLQHLKESAKSELPRKSEKSIFSV
jgi:hypothetical protein